MIDYYTRIAPYVLPHLQGRALTLKRYPNGVEAQYFYEKNAPEPPPGLGQDGHDPDPHRRAHDRLRPRRRPADAGVAGQPRRPGAAHLAGEGGGPARADDPRLRPRSRARRRRSWSARASRCTCARSSSTSGWRASRRPRARRGCRSTSRSTSRPPTRRPSASRRRSRSCWSAATRSSSSPRCARTGARARCSSTGARTTSTRRPSPPTRCAPRSARRSRRRCAGRRSRRSRSPRTRTSSSFTSADVLERGGRARRPVRARRGARQELPEL